MRIWWIRDCEKTKRHEFHIFSLDALPPRICWTSAAAEERERYNHHVIHFLNLLFCFCANSFGIYRPTRQHEGKVPPAQAINAHKTKFPGKRIRWEKMFVRFSRPPLHPFCVYPIPSAFKVIGSIRFPSAIHKKIVRHNHKMKAPNAQLGVQLPLNWKCLIRLLLPNL
jgi:hypothetical protein